MEDTQAPTHRRRPSRAQQQVMGVFVFLMCLVGSVLFGQRQLQLAREVARVQSAGLPAQATVIAVEGCSRFGASFTLRFTTESGDTRIVNHVSYVLSCSDHIQVGESTGIHYVPDDPATLLTQAELDDLPITIVLNVLLDLVLIGCGAMVAWVVFLKPLAAWLHAPTHVG